MTTNKTTDGITAGTPATISIGSDSYKAEIVKVTACTVTARYTGSGRELTFRRSGESWVAKRHHFLSIGEAHDHRDPSF